MFTEHIKSNVQTAKCHDPYPQKPKKLSRRFLLWRGNLLTGKNMADLGQNRHFLSAIMIPGKVWLPILVIWNKLPNDNCNQYTLHSSPNLQPQLPKLRVILKKIYT